MIKPTSKTQQTYHMIMILIDSGITNIKRTANEIVWPCDRSFIILPMATIDAHTYKIRINIIRTISWTRSHEHVAN